MKQKINFFHLFSHGQFLFGQNITNFLISDLMFYLSFNISKEIRLQEFG